MRLNEYDLNVYAPDTRPLMQALLATLADIDFAYEQDVEKAVSTTTENPRLKARVLQTLQQRHRERREPYLRQISVLGLGYRTARPEDRPHLRG